MSTLAILQSERAHLLQLISDRETTPEENLKSLEAEVVNMGARHISTLNTVVFGPIRYALSSAFNSEIVLSMPDGLLDPSEFLARGKNVYIPVQVNVETNVDLSVEDEDDEERTLEDVVTDELNLIASKYSVLSVPGRFVHSEMAEFEDEEDGEEPHKPSYNFISYFEADKEVFPFPVHEGAPRWLATAMNDVEIEEVEKPDPAIAARAEAEAAAALKAAEEKRLEEEKRAAEANKIAKNEEAAKLAAEATAAKSTPVSNPDSAPALTAFVDPAAVNNVQGGVAAKETASKPNAKPQTADASKK